MPAASPPVFADLLNAALEEKNVSARELARRMHNLDPEGPTYTTRLRYVNFWKGGGRAPGPDDVALVAESLEMKPWELDATPVGEQYRRELAAVEKERDDLARQVRLLRERGFRPQEQPKHQPRRKQNG